MIDTVISYCTNDFRFIESNIQECLKFSNKVIVPICDHLLDGTPENEDLLNETFKLKKYGNVEFYMFNWDNTQHSRYWHNVARQLGHNQTSADYVLHVDADEIFDGDLMKQYVEDKDYTNYDVVAFECYWYFREPIYRAKTTEQAGVLYKREVYNESITFTEMERWYYRTIQQLKPKEHCTYKENILCHHYSWVRTKEEMLKKVVSWGHNKDRDWVSLVNSEFDKEFNGIDFVHGYSYDIVKSMI